MERERPPDDISPEEFFTRWAPGAVARDPSRHSRLGDTKATIAFHLTGEAGGRFAIDIADGEVSGRCAQVEDADLRVRVDVGTWRKLNSGVLSAPEALLRRRLKLEGNLLLAIKLHLIIG